MRKKTDVQSRGVGKGGEDGPPPPSGPNFKILQKGHPFCFSLGGQKKFSAPVGAEIYSFFIKNLPIFDQKSQFLKHFFNKNAYFRIKNLPAALFT